MKFRVEYKNKPTPLKVCGSLFLLGPLGLLLATVSLNLKSPKWTCVSLEASQKQRDTRLRFCSILVPVL